MTARQILAAVAANKSEVYVGNLGKDRLALTLKRYLTSVLERMVRGRVPH